MQVVDSLEMHISRETEAPKVSASSPSSASHSQFYNHNRFYKALQQINTYSSHSLKDSTLSVSTSILLITPFSPFINQTPPFFPQTDKMFARTAAFALFVAGLAAAHAHNETIATTTKVVEEYTTYCPHPTTLTYGEKTYTVTEATTLTITDCPCTITEVSQSRARTFWYSVRQDELLAEDNPADMEIDSPSPRTSRPSLSLRPPSLTRTPCPCLLTRTRRSPLLPRPSPPRTSSSLAASRPAARLASSSLPVSPPLVCLPCKAEFPTPKLPFRPPIFPLEIQRWNLLGCRGGASKLVREREMVRGTLWVSVSETRWSKRECRVSLELRGTIC